MNGSKPGNFRSSRYTVDLDLTEVLTAVIDAQGKQKEKYTLHWLLIRLSEDQVKLMSVISQAFPELGKQVPRFFQKRVKCYSRAMRMRKLVGFRSASVIEDEAVRRAWNDTRAMMKEVSLMQNGSIKGLLDDHREILKRICNAMVDLVLEKEGGRVDLDIDALRKFLEG